MKISKSYVCRIVLSIIFIGAAICVWPLNVLNLGSTKYYPDSREEWDIGEYVVCDTNSHVVTDIELINDIEFESIDYYYAEDISDFEGTLRVKVFDDKGSLLLFTERYIAECRNGDYLTIPLDLMMTEGEKSYYVELDSDSPIYLYSISNYGPELYVGHTFVNGNILNRNILINLGVRECVSKSTGICLIVLMVFVSILILIPRGKREERINKTGIFRIILTLGFLILFFVFSYYQLLYEYILDYSVTKILIIILFLISFLTIVGHCIVFKSQSEHSLELYFVIAMIGWGLVYLLLFIPFCGADEESHFIAVNEYVNDILGVEAKDENGFVYIRNEDIIDYSNKIMNIEWFERYYSGNALLDATANRESYITYSDTTVRGARPLRYLPYIIGVALGRVFKVSYITSFFVTSMLGYICYSVIMYYSIKILPFGKWLLFFIAQLPVSLYTATTITYDVVLFAGVTFLFALFTRAITDSKCRITAKWMVIALAISCIVMPIKFAYIPLVFLLICIPNDRFTFGVGKIKLIKKLFVVIVILFTFCDSRFWQHIHLMTNVNARELNDIGYEYIENIRNYITWSSFVERSNINNLVDLLFTTVVDFVMSFLGGFINVEYGSIFQISLWVIVILLSIIACEREFEIPKEYRRPILVLSSISLLAVFFAVSVFSTPFGHKSITSFGARYLLPCTFPILLCLKNKGLRLERDVNLGKMVIAMDIVRAVSIVQVIVSFVSR